MVKHIVMWKIKKEFNENEKDVAKSTVKEILENLNGKIEGLINIEVGFNIKNNGYDLCLLATYKSEEALNFYQSHPLHLECKKYIHTVIEDRTCCDYIV